MIFENVCVCVCVGGGGGGEGGVVKASTRSIAQGELGQSVQADLGQNCLLFINFLSKNTCIPCDSVKFLNKMDPK